MSVASNNIEDSTPPAAEAQGAQPDAVATGIQSDILDIPAHQPVTRSKKAKVLAGKQNKPAAGNATTSSVPGETQGRDRLPFIAPVSKLMPVGDLSPHPMNDKIYGRDVDASFVSAVKRNGIYTPLLITHDNKVISGHRRLEAAKQAGIREVPVVLFDSSDELDIHEAIVAANRQRQKSNEQTAREFKVLLAVETERAKARMGGRENFPQDMRGKACDIAAAKLGISGRHAEHAADVVDKIDQLKAEGKTDEADDLRQRLKKSVNGAFKRLIVLNLRAEQGITRPPAADADAPQSEGKAAVITRLLDTLAEGVEDWPLEKLLSFETVLPLLLQNFQAPKVQEQEAA